MKAGRPVKRSLTIAGHRTSISLERAFWEALKAHADASGRPLADIVSDIDEIRGDAGLSSAIRVWLYEKAAGYGAEGGQPWKPSESEPVKPRLTVLTLGVDDLDRAVAFYRDGLKLKTEGIMGTEFEYGAVAFFELQSGVKLAVWPRKSLARDSGVPVGPRSATEFSLGHNVTSREEVDRVMEEATAAGATIVKPAENTFWGGYAGYFQDPDGHLWEVLWNPELLPDD